MGTPKKVPLISGNPYIGFRGNDPKQGSRLASQLREVPKIREPFLGGPFNKDSGWLYWDNGKENGNYYNGELNGKENGK